MEKQIIKERARINLGKEINRILKLDYDYGVGDEIPGFSNAVAQYKAAHECRARDIISDLKAAGFEMVEGSYKFSKGYLGINCSVTLVKGFKVARLRYNEFNQGFLVESEKSGGAYTFRPEEY